MTINVTTIQNQDIVDSYHTKRLFHPTKTPGGKNVQLFLSINLMQMEHMAYYFFWYK